VGAAALRYEALSDKRVIDLVNDQFVPVWLNIRKEAVPTVAVLDQVMLKAQLDSSRHVSDLASRGFFLRSVVLTPDGTELLNPQATTVLDSIKTYSSHGYYAYAQVKAVDYLVMLQGALNRYRAVAGLQ
jgi:hypothetical protein